MLRQPSPLAAALIAGAAIATIDCLLAWGTGKVVDPVTYLGNALTVGSAGGAVGFLLMLWVQAASRVQLRQSLQKEVLEKFPNPIRMSDADGRCIHVNHAWIEFTGLQPEACLGQGWLQAIHPEDRAAAQATCHAALASREAYSLTYRLGHHTGDFHRISDYGKPFLDPEGHFAGFLSAGYDLEATQRALEAQHTLEARLRQAEKMEAIGHLTGGIAHDFNNILASIIGYAQLGQTRPASISGEKMQSYLQQIHKAGLRGRDLIAQLLAFSRGSETLPQRLAPAQAAEETLHLLRATLPATLHIDLTGETHLPEISLNPVQFHQILMNLCINSRDATAGNGCLRIDLARVDIGIPVACDSCHREFSGAHVRISVSDDGPGIDPELRRRIFDPFFTTKAMGKGTGLGLSVVHGIVHAQGGHLRVRDRPGGGCLFEIFLPAQDILPVQPAGTTTPATDGESLPPAHIALVDDDMTVASFLREMLELEGCRVRVFANGRDALETLQDPAAAFDIVISDQIMEGLTGIELATALHPLRPELPLILCTACTPTELGPGPLPANVIAVLCKPVPLEKIIATLRSGLGTARPGNPGAPPGTEGPRLNPEAEATTVCASVQR